MFSVYAYTGKVYGSFTYTFGLWNSVLRELTTFEFIIISLMKTKHEKLKISKSYKSFLPSSSSLESLRRRDMAKEENTPAKIGNNAFPLIVSIFSKCRTRIKFCQPATSTSEFALFTCTFCKYI